MKPATAQSGRRSSLGKNLLLLGASVFFALLILEAGLRLTAPKSPAAAPETERTDWVQVPERVWTEYHPVLGWYHQASKVTDLKTPFVDVKVVTNAAGMRSYRNYTKEKTEGVLRAAFLGDSFTFGFGVQDTEVLTAVLEAGMPKLEALNFGVAGYGLDQMLMLYRTLAVDYRPDVVFIDIFPEDFWRCTRAFADSGHAKPYFTLEAGGRLELHNNPVPPPYTLKKGQFPQVIRTSGPEALLNHSLLYKTASRALEKLAKNLKLTDPDSSPEWRLGRAVLAALVEDIRRQGSRPVIVLVPSEGWARSARRDSTQKSLLRFAEREGVDLIDLQKVFHEAVSREPLTDYYIENDWHWTAKGHALAAREIRAYLEAWKPGAGS